MTNERPISIILSERFRKDVKHLLKKYRHVREDVQVLIDELESGAIPAIRFLEQLFPYTKLGSKIVTSPKAKVVAIASFIIYEPQRAYILSLYTLRANNPISAPKPLTKSFKTLVYLPMNKEPN